MRTLTLARKTTKVRSSGDIIDMLSEIESVLDKTLSKLSLTFLLKETEHTATHL